jgi:hypothetical protein
MSHACNLCFFAASGLPAALVARRLWAGPSGLRVAGGQAGPRARTGERMRAQGNVKWRSSFHCLKVC